MNWLGVVVAIIAGLAIITAVVFLYVHRDGDKEDKEDKPERPHASLNGRHRRYSREQLERLRDPVTGHLRGRTWVERRAVELRRLASGHDSREHRK